MSEELDLIARDNKKLADITPEPPRRIDERNNHAKRQNNKSFGGKQQEHSRRRSGNIITSPKTYGASEFAQKETFATKRNDFNRIFRKPAELKRHQQYRCADIRKPPTTQKITKGQTPTEIRGNNKKRAKTLQKILPRR